MLPVVVSESSLGSNRGVWSLRTQSNDPEKPFVTSGVRLGTPAVTTRGLKEEEMKIIGRLILKVLENVNDDKAIAEVKIEVVELMKKFPLYKG